MMNWFKRSKPASTAPAAPADKAAAAPAPASTATAKAQEPAQPAEADSASADLATTAAPATAAAAAQADAPASGATGTAGDEPAGAAPGAAAPASATPASASGPTAPSGGSNQNAGGTSSPGASPLGAARVRAAAQQDSGATSDTSELNPKIVQAVQFSNSQTASYAPTQIATGPDMMISQAAGLVAQSAAAYFDGVTKIALASQGVLMKQMTQDLVAGEAVKAAEDAVGILATDIFMGAAAAVAAAAGAMEAESASFAIDRIDQSIAKYSSLLQNRQS